MVNFNVVRKYASYVLLTILPVSTFMVTLIPMGILYAGLTTLGVIVLCVFVSNMLLKNSFTGMLEGKGLLTIMLDSKGVLGFTVLGVDTKNGNISGEIGGKNISVKYESNLIHSLPAPNVVKDAYYVSKIDGKEKLVIDFEHFRQFKFGYEQYPVLVFNSISGQLITKDYLGDKEKGLIAHLIFNANEIGKSLNRSMLNFSRAVVEADREQTGLDFKTILFWVIGIIIFGGVCWMLWQTFFSNGGGDVVSSVSSSLVTKGG